MSSLATPQLSSLPAASATKRIGIVDIGSNTVRMVVFDAPARLPVPIFNERVACRLGRGLGKSGRLNPAGVDLAFQTLSRFTRLAGEMAVDKFVLLATAAVRDAEDGIDFANEVETRFGYPVTILTGADEACLGAMGILGGSPDADGLFGDLGGGSLDLVSIHGGEFGADATFPLGHLRLAEEADGDIHKAKGIVDRHLESVPWIDGFDGRNLYAVGGAWRTLASIFIDQTDYPLHVLDNFSISANDARKLTKVIAAQSPVSLEKIPGIARRRAETLPFAALTMNRLLKFTKPKELVFSGYGLREGQFFKMLPEDMKRQDPLISACQGFAERGGRFAAHGEEISTWLAPLFPDMSPKDFRLCRAAALLSDVGWTEHPDYRALHSFLRVLRLPISGVTHRERVMLALAVFVRYNGRRKQYEVKEVRSLLSKEDQPIASILGLGLRFAHSLSGGIPGLLPRAKLIRNDHKLTLDQGDEPEIFASDAVSRIFRELSETMELTGEIV